MPRRIAANRIIFGSKEFIQYAIEIEGCIVKDYYPLTEELPFTEWLGGTITLSDDAEGCLRAYKDGKLLIQDSY